MTVRTINMDVEVDLSDFDDDDIEQEAIDRGFILSEVVDDSDIVEMFYAFKLGRDDKALELAKKIAMDHTGNIL